VGSNFCGNGGGVGLLGQGSNGSGGTSSSRNAGGGSGGGTSSPEFNTPFPAGYGAGGGGQNDGSVVTAGGGGGGLAYRNNITVVPGTSYTVVVGNGGNGAPTGGSFANCVGNPGSGGAVRIIWPGATRLFPSTDVGTP
jgi:hypothetical protein